MWYFSLQTFVQFCKKFKVTEFYNVTKGCVNIHNYLLTLNLDKERLMVTYCRIWAGKNTDFVAKFLLKVNFAIKFLK